MFELNNLKPARGATKDRFRVGRGQGSGNGTTAGRGIKGQRSRSGGSGAGWFEGGQMPLYRRIPKSGFAPPNRVPYQVLNLADFERFDASEAVTPDTLAALGMVSGRNPRVKVLGVGDVSAAFRVSVHAISASAREKIEAKGGSVEILPWSRTGRTDG